MPTSEPSPHALDEMVAEIVSILARGYPRYRKRRRISPESGGEAKKVKYSQVLTEKRLDSSSYRSLHS